MLRCEKDTAGSVGMRQRHEHEREAEDTLGRVAWIVS